MSHALRNPRANRSQTSAPCENLLLISGFVNVALDITPYQTGYDETAPARPFSGLFGQGLEASESQLECARRRPELAGCDDDYERELTDA